MFVVDLQWFTATQAMTTISLVFLILAFAMLAYWLCTEARFFFIKALIISLLFMTCKYLVTISFEFVQNISYPEISDANFKCAI